MTRWFYLAIAFTVLAFAISGYVGIFQYDRLPDQVPTHWDIYGQPDAFTPKEKILPTFLLLPLIMIGMLGLTLVLPWLSPQHFKVDTFRATYGYVMMLVTALLCYMHGVILLASLGQGQYLQKLLFGGLFLAFALIGNVLGKIRRNFWIGVRTPWTLASDQVWIQTHRLAAWLFVAAGVLGFVAVLAGVPFVLCFVGLMVAALAPVIYSLVLYKRLEREGKLQGEANDGVGAPTPSLPAGNSG